MTKKLLLPIVMLLLITCNSNKTETSNDKTAMKDGTIQNVIDSLVRKHGEEYRLRIESGVKQAAAFWTPKDGNDSAFVALCNEQFISDPVELDKLFQRISGNLETIYGSFNKIVLGLTTPLHLDRGEILSIDESFGSYNPTTHLTEDFFNNKIAFVIALNFPAYSLAQKTEKANEWDRQQWAYARMGDLFDSRIPAEVNQLIVNANTRSEMYIADYNIFAGKLLTNEGKALFPADMKLLSHWNLRDEIKTNYGDRGGLEKQRMIYEVMKRIVSQEIPRIVINSPKYNWNPFNNTVTENGVAIDAEPEPSTRFDVLLQFFNAQQKADPYYPGLNTYIRRNFESDMEIPLEDVKELFKTYLSSPEVAKVADVIKKRLGRDLEPFDIWYDGFKTRTSIPAETLDKITRTKYPDPGAVQADLPEILVKLGFTRERADVICSGIQVDPARGSGHAWGAESRDQKSRLRTRIFANGMDYKGYNIAVHEFGHNVEQTITLRDMDYYMLKGVPNTAFTEAVAFMFQKYDLQLLGMKSSNELQDYYNNLDNFWSLYEIMGVSLVDIGTWKWLYDHPTATASELKDAVNSIARDIWNQFYAPVFGEKDQPILAIYSHMINAPLYLPNYAYGHIIEFQLAEYLRDKNFARELEKMLRQGRLTPQQWMQGAVGSQISVHPILNAVNEALEKLDGV